MSVETNLVGQMVGWESWSYVLGRDVELWGEVRAVYVNPHGGLYALVMIVENEGQDENFPRRAIRELPVAGLMVVENLDG